MEIDVFLVVFCAIQMICKSSHSPCIGNCPPECDSYIPNGRVSNCLGGHICSYYCDDGYRATTSMLTCIGGKLESLDILNDQELCEPLSCSEEIPNGALDSSCSPKVGHGCGYTCHSGFQKLSGVSRITCQVTAEWTSNPHSLCTNSSQCPYEVPDGALDLSCQRRPGDTCSFSCNEGYHRSVDEALSCSSSLSWSEPLESLCFRIKCPTTIENGYIQDSCTREFDETCQFYKCATGYVKPPSPPRLKCNSEGQWEWNKDEGLPCAEADSICPSTIKHGNINENCHRQPGAVCRYSCEPRCTKEWSIFELTCSASGYWIPSTRNLCKDCRPNKCPSVIPNGQIYLSCSLLLNTRCGFTCHFGCHKLWNSLYCNSLGYWTDSTLACECSVTSTPSYSKPKDETGSGTLAGVIIGVIVLFTMIAILTSIRSRRRRRQEAREDDACNTSQPTDYDSVPTPRRVAYPSARPLHGSSTGINYTNRDSSLQTPFLTPQSGERTDSQEPPEYSVSHTTDSREPPPSYEEVTSNPLMYK